MAGRKGTWFARRLSALVVAIVVSVLVAEVGLRLAGWVYRAHQNRGTGLSAADERAYRVLCIGESTTANGGRSSYPSQLEQVLNERGGGRRFRVFNEGLPGRDTATLAARLVSNLERLRPDVVVTMMGINDRSFTPVYDPVAPPPWSLRDTVRSLRIVKLAKLVASRLQALERARPRDAVRRAGSWIDLAPQEQSGRAVSGGSAAPPTSLDDPQALVDAAYRSLATGRPDDAERWLRRAADIAPSDPHVAMRLGDFLCGTDRLTEGAALLERAREQDPAEPEIGFTLANCYREHREYARAEPVYWSTIALDPSDAWPYIDLAISFTEQRRYADCEGVLERGIAADPKVDEAYLRLTDCYWAEARYRDAANAVERLIAMNPENDRAYGQAARCYQRLDEPEKARAYLERANAARLAGVNPVTVKNYRWIAETLRVRGVHHVAVQYPTRPVDLLQATIGDAPGVVLVDNEATFKDAIEREGYDAIFENRFAGDFGHGTVRGNRLLAEDVAVAVLEVAANEPARAP